jgi:lysophospholipase L1-like esterase
LARYRFTTTPATGLAAFATYRIDTASGSTSAATIESAATAGQVVGPTLRTNDTGTLPPFAGTVDTLYAKQLTPSGVVTGSPVTLTGTLMEATSGSNTPEALNGTYARPSGAWSSATAYTGQEVVTYGGGTYRAVAASTNVTPGTDGSKWESWGGGGTTFPLYTSNIDPTKFLKWRKALAKVRAGAGSAKLLCVGDSTIAGAFVNQQASVPGRLSALLNSYYVKSDIDTIFASNGMSATVTVDSRVTVGTGWTANFASWGAGGWSSASGAAGSLSYTPNTSFDTVTIYYVKNSGHGSVTVNVDGGASLGTINASNASLAVASTTYTVTAGTHTINITGATGGQVFILGIEVALSTAPAVHVANAGKGASKTSDWIGTSGPYDFLTMFDLYQPDLTIIDLGINDAGVSTSTSTYQTNLTTIVTKAQLYGDVLLTSFPPSGGSPHSTVEPTYLPILQAVATAKGCGYVDLYSRWVSYASANALGFMNDNLHPNSLGYADWAQAIFNALRTI